MAWYLAPSLEVGRSETNARWPNRDKASDGTIGDQAHSESKSDHNPNSRGSVNAWDCDKDGVDVWEIIEAFENHPSSHYWIFNRQIADKDDNWTRRPYSGSNPHDKHVHMSIRQSQSAEQDKRPWGIVDMAITNADAELIASKVWTSGSGTQVNYRTEAMFSQRDTSAQPGNAEVNRQAEKLDALERKLDQLLAIPPGTVIVDQQQLEDAVREVIGSVDEIN